MIRNTYTCTLRLKTAQIELDKVTAQLREKQEKLAAIEAKVHKCLPGDVLT